MAPAEFLAGVPPDGVFARSAEAGGDDVGSGRPANAGLPTALAIIAALSLVMPGGTVAQPARPGIEEPRGFLGGPSLERHALRFERDGVRLDVPRNHLIGWYPTRMTQSPPGFTAMAAFPGFAAATRETIRCFDVLGVADVRECDVVLFLPEEPAGHALVPGRPFWSSFDPDAAPEPAEHGLSRYPKRPWMYVWIGRDSHETLSVSCLLQLHRCDMRMVAAGLHWRVQFPHRLRSEWRAIVDGLRSLIASHQVP